jgi:predicted  nucleic acid-binding Zn-ribbon protein
MNRAGIYHRESADVRLRGDGRDLMIGKCPKCGHSRKVFVNAGSTPLAACCPKCGVGLIPRHDALDQTETRPRESDAAFLSTVVTAGLGTELKQMRPPTDEEIDAWLKENMRININAVIGSGKK